MHERNERGQFIKNCGIVDLTGRRYGMLTVVGLDGVINKRSFWKVRCDCGNEKVVRGDTLKKICSCGCVKKKQDIINLGISYNHQCTGHPAFSIWCNMMNRCYSEHNTFYQDYGGRGILVCEEWHDIKNFCDWADKTGFRQGLSIERIDVNGNYKPDNCKWIPRCEQNWNRRDTVYFYINGERKPLAKTARKYGLDPKKVKRRWNSGIRDPELLLYAGNLKDLYALRR